MLYHFSSNRVTDAKTSLNFMLTVLLLLKSTMQSIYTLVWSFQTSAALLDPQNFPRRPQIGCGPVGPGLAEICKADPRVQSNKKWTI
jgi:hypothetical protein